MDAANKCEKHSVAPSAIFSNMNLTKCIIDVMVFKNMEKIVVRMQNSVNGVPLRRDITLEYAHPSVFTGADLVNWILYNTEIATTENALYMANLLFSNGLFFSITRHQMMVTNDEHCYRFQAPNYWISNISQPGDYEYAVYLCKKHMEVKDLSGMADYEIERLEYFKKIYCNKWVHINLQAETEIKIVDKKNDLYEKKLTDTQEQAFWDFHRPMKNSF
ncbi:hypothetical protein QTP88_011893 [Uroleucon formosanum]